MLELQVYHKDRTDLENETQTVQDTNTKLSTIASEKYNIDLENIDSYMPRGKEYQERIDALEKRLIKQARNERSSLYA